MVSITVRGGVRIIESNGLPGHPVGRFPNRGNPHAIEAQSYRFEVPARPATAHHDTALGMHPFGVAVNGVPFDPGAAEWFRGDRGSAWRYEALSGAVPLGVDDNFAHVQPNGAYHYHGLPVGLLEELGWTPTAHSPLVGWAADGFPIYARTGFADGEGGAVAELRSSYRLREGRRPGGSKPGGVHDGAFVADYEYVPGLGDLDACNGRFAVTPEFPEGTYHYVLTQAFPLVPRCFSGTPDDSFVRDRRGPPGRRGPPRR